MKKILLLVVFSIISIGTYAQVNNPGCADLTLRWNISLQRYEVYMRPTFSSVGQGSTTFNMGNSQITVVAPAATSPDQPFINTSYNGGGWTNQDNIYAPASQPGSDFHASYTIGAPIVLTAGQETLLYSFVYPDGLCRDGLRLYLNGVDPNSSASGMMGGDFYNTINSPAWDTFCNVYANTGTVCNPCNITAPELVK